jgi:hypothetical protein
MLSDSSRRPKRDTAIDHQSNTSHRSILKRDVGSSHRIAFFAADQSGGQCCTFRIGTRVRREDVVPRKLTRRLRTVHRSTDSDAGSHAVQQPHLALPNYVHRLIALNRSTPAWNLRKSWLGVHSLLDRAMVLLDAVDQNLDRRWRHWLRSIPSFFDHYLPLLRVVGTRQQIDAITFPVERADGGWISMLAVQLSNSPEACRT